MEKKSLKKFKMINMATYPGAIIALYILYPTFLEINQNLKYYIGWFVMFIMGVIFLNHRFLSIIEQAKDTADIEDFLNTWGRAKISSNPENYFTPQMYKSYKHNFRYTLIYLAYSGLSLLIVFIFML